MVNVDDDGIKMFGLILVVAIILILLSSCAMPSNTSTCPEGSYSCSESPCGCCISNSDGSVNYCSGCEGYSLNDEGLCCSSEYDCGTGSCTNPLFCDTYDCCPGSSCETQIGILKPICKPCTENSVCNPEVEDSCCENMRCSINGFCEDCKTLTCTPETVATDCCKDSECTDNKCISCERACKTEMDCCDEWQCTSGTCENCNRACDPLNPCCDGDSCSSSNKCEGCSEGASCSVDKPCCSGFSCNLDSGKCESCIKPCETSEDCCDTGTCNPLTKMCQYPNDCSNLPCMNIGEKCQLCGNDGCVECTDNTICASSGGVPVCKSQGSCAVGQYDCSSEYLNCNCCDAVTGKCADEKTKVDCSTISGCETCSCISYDVIVCSEKNGNSLYCDKKGCFDVLISDPIFIDPVCHDCSMDSGACCTYLVPENALPSGISKVDLNVCLSGYKMGNECVAKVTYSMDDESGYYTYRFTYAGQSSVEGQSKVGPSEMVISTVKVESQTICDGMTSDRFTEPKYYTVG